MSLVAHERLPALAQLNHALHASLLAVVFTVIAGLLVSRVAGALGDTIARAEAALRESEERWVTTLASIGDAVIAADAAGRTTFMNPTAEALTGWGLGEAARKPATDVLHIVD